MRISIVNIITAAIKVKTTTRKERKSHLGSATTPPSSPSHHNDYHGQQRSIITKRRGHYSGTNISSRTASPYHRHHYKSSSGHHTGRHNYPRLPSRHYDDSTRDNRKQTHSMSGNDGNNYDSNHPQQTYRRRRTRSLSPRH